MMPTPEVQFDVVYTITAGAPTTNDVSVQLTGLIGTTIKWSVLANYHVTTTSA
jgi:hypothetical protein